MSKKETILIKATSILPFKNGLIAGVGRSTIELLNQFAVMDENDLDISYYCTGLKSLKKWHPDWPFNYYSLPFSLRGSSRISRFLEPLIRKYVLKRDLTHITNNYDVVYEGERFVVTIHDMILYRMNPSSRDAFEKIGRESLAIATCSEFSKKEIMSLLHVPEEKISVIPWGINHSLFYKREDEKINEVLEKYKIKGDYFFSCSCGSKRKNTDILIEAFHRFSKNRVCVSLVLTWGNCPEEIRIKYKKDIEENRIVIISGVSDDELACLYSGAMATFFISSGEGFGFPLLESFACGTPCVTCRNTSLPEIGKDLAFYVAERDVEQTINAMSHYSKEMKDDGSVLIKYARKYDWRQTALQYIEFYKSALKRS